MDDNEYVKCMIFAGWIDVEDVDAEYQAYLDATWGDQENTMDYGEWKETFRNEIKDHAEYDKWAAENVPFQSGKYQPDIDNEANNRIHALSSYDYYLRR